MDLAQQHAQETHDIRRAVGVILDLHEQGGPPGYDGGKKINGRQRHLLVDTLGLLLRVVVHPANLQDREGATLVLADLGPQFPRLQHLWADQGSTGPILEALAAERGWSVERWSTVRRDGALWSRLMGSVCGSRCPQHSSRSPTDGLGSVHWPGSAGIAG
jgi:transposase